VELILSLQNADLARAFRDDAAWEVGARCYGSDFEHVSVNWVERPVVHSGVEQFRKAWLKWLAPWETYRQDIDEVIDCGDRVLLLVTPLRANEREQRGGQARRSLALDRARRHGRAYGKLLRPRRSPQSRRSGRVGEALRAAGISE
jgi:hypothetical protein